MILPVILAAAISFAESPTLALQIRLERAGYSCNTIDGSWGAKSEAALARYLKDRGLRVSGTVDDVARTIFPNLGKNLFREDTVTEDDLASIVEMPTDPAAKAEMGHMGYSSIREMFAERGHLSRAALAKLNPHIDWAKVKPGDKIRIPDFPDMERDLAAWPRKSKASDIPLAALIRISLSRREVVAYDEAGRVIGFFPCSIARDKAKLPEAGRLKVVTRIAHPNYTWSPEQKSQGGKVSRQILPPGPRNPVGVAWIGLDLAGYGIHGTPYPESVGNAESHGCFRLSNWNAARLYSMTDIGTRVVIVK